MIWKEGRKGSGVGWGEEEKGREWNRVGKREERRGEKREERKDVEEERKR